MARLQAGLAPLCDPAWVSRLSPGAIAWFALEMARARLTTAVSLGRQRLSSTGAVHQLALEGKETAVSC